MKSSTAALVGSVEAPTVEWKVFFDPTDPKRQFWDLAVIVPLLAYLLVSLPFSLAFNYEPVGGHENFEFVVDLMFCADIGVSFATGLLITDVGDDLADDYVEMGAAYVAKEYLKSWLMLDLVSGIPLGLITSNAVASRLTYIKLLKSGKALKALRVLRLFKLTKIVKISNTLLTERRLEELEELFQLNPVRSMFLMFNILLKIAYIAHLLCCGWVAVGRDGDERGDQNWLNEQGFTHVDTEQGKSMGDVYLLGVCSCLI